MYSMYLLSNCPKVYLAFISLSQEVFGLAFTNCLKKLRTVTTSLLWYKHEIKLKDEVGMAVPKSTQTRFVGIITSTIHLYACFLSMRVNTCINDNRCKIYIAEKCLFIAYHESHENWIPPPSPKIPRYTGIHACII